MPESAIPRFAKTLGVISVKGGVGKTTVAINLSASLAHNRKKQVLLIDSNFSTPHVALSLGYPQPQNHIHAVLNNKISIFDAIYYNPLGFYVLPGSFSPMNVDVSSFSQRINELREYFDYIVLDTSPSLHEEFFAALNASDEVIAVTSPDYPTLSSTMHAVSLAKKQGVSVKGIVVNKVRNKSWELSSKDIQDCTGLPVLSVFRDDSLVPKSISLGIPIPFFEPRSKLSRRYKDLANHVDGVPQGNSLFSQVGNWFSSRFTLKGGSLD